MVVSVLVNRHSTIETPDKLKFLLRARGNTCLFLAFEVSFFSGGLPPIKADLNFFILISITETKKFSVKTWIRCNSVAVNGFASKASSTW